MGRKTPHYFFVLTIVTITSNTKASTALLHEFALNECGYANNLLNIYRGIAPITNALPSFKVAIYYEEFPVCKYPDPFYHYTENPQSWYFFVCFLSAVQRYVTV